MRRQPHVGPAAGYLQVTPGWPSSPGAPGSRTVVRHCIYTRWTRGVAVRMGTSELQRGVRAVRTQARFVGWVLPFPGTGSLLASLETPPLPCAR